MPPLIVGIARRRRMQRFRLGWLTMVGGILACVGITAAAERPFADVGCDLQDGEVGRVSTILGATSLELENGLIVKLAAVRLPDSPIIAEAAVGFLTNLALGQNVWLRYGDLQRDRYDRATAQVFLVGDGEDLWIQAALISAGLTLASGFAEDRQCLADLLRLEREARSMATGIWGEETIPNAWSDAIRLGEDRYQLVEGDVISVGRTANTIYLNFGRDWTNDLTVTINVVEAEIIEAVGGPLENLTGKRIRVRGWLSQRDGPWIRVRHSLGKA